MVGHLNRMCESRSVKWDMGGKVKRGKVRERPNKSQNDEII